MPAPLDFRNYGYGGANIISGLSGLFDTSEAELRRSQAELRRAQTESLRAAMEAKRTQEADALMQRNNSLSYMADLGMSDAQSRMALNNPNLYKMLHPTAKAAQFTPNQAMDIREGSLASMIRLMQDMGAGSDMAGGGYFTKPQRDFEFTSPSTWFDSDQPLYDVETSGTDMMYDLNPEVLEWVFKGGAGSGMSKLEQLQGIATQLDTRMKMGGQPMGFGPHFRNIVKGMTDPDGRVRYDELMQYLGQALQGIQRQPVGGGPGNIDNQLKRFTGG